MWSTLWRRYLDLLVRRPLPTKIVTSAVLGFLGDASAQVIEHASHVSAPSTSFNTTHVAGAPPLPVFGWDAARTARITLYGALLAAPVTHVWYNVLEAVAGRGTGPRAVVRKVFLDQTLCAPVMTAAFFVAIGAMEQWQAAVSAHRLAQAADLWWPTLCANWLVWPAALAINFAFVPLAARVGFSNAIGLGWTIYLSWVNASEERAEVRQGLTVPPPPKGI
ncbi:hypothetical protein CXG81DRAFT_9969 [Caulochytrium protostelioides]|uniref:Uncharacterized protein n=1 Tax=Caulochytrium protostelioides TaxID=1555241 RepID=A0A4P9XCG6_9FUNG|nr:hypothetical protein CXG81DRAFT_9969 [Caulochytrium protostelioides]|eukprot:RKP03128.1 hypothetical protein CXG81DRAFT_9969 [Caulochytrium protostelioides]